MQLPVYFISDVHLKLSVDQEEKARRKKLYRLLDKICETGGTCETVAVSMFIIRSSETVKHWHKHAYL